MIDVHSHLLPDIDDGSRSVAQSALVLKQFARITSYNVCYTKLLRHCEPGCDVIRRDAGCGLDGRRREYRNNFV